MKYYISGKIEGEPDFKNRFEEAGKQLIELGFEIVNPVTEIEETNGKTWFDYIIDCLTLIYNENPDGIYLLTGWRDSIGAQIERLVFKKLGKHIRAENNDTDSINHPKHYTFGKYEVYDVLADWFIDDPILWQVGKYISRANHKGMYDADLKKARWYLDKAIERGKND